MLVVGWPLYLDWLLPMKNTLKRLELQLVIPPYFQLVFKGFDKVVEEQTIELFGFEDRMEESNIWKLRNICPLVMSGKSLRGRKH